MAKDALRFLDAEGVNIPTPFNVTCVLDKERSLKEYVNYMLDRTNAMFEYEGLPETIPAYMLELYLQIFGYAAFLKVDETNPIHIPSLVETKPGLYIFYGGIGGERDIYYRPKLFTAANPRLKESIQATILYDKDGEKGDRPCVIMRNDRNYCGLLPLFNRYAAQLVENDISIRSAQINARAQVGIEASTDRDRETARKYFDDLEAGKLGVIGETAFLDGIRISNVGTQSANVVIQLIELHQYLKASWYNEMGLNVNFNMKREYMSEEEIAVNTDILLPLVDDMLACREEACELINATFGTNIKVRKSSAWANKEQEDLAALAEASAAGGIGLKETIDNKIEDSFSPTKPTEPGSVTNVETNDKEVEADAGDVSTQVSEEVQNTTEEGGSGDDNGTGEITQNQSESTESGDESEKPADVNVTVIINNGDNSEVSVEPEKGSDDSVVLDESPSSEESEESDSE